MCSEPCASHSDTPWFCVYSKPRAEKDIERRIKEEGFPVLLPMEEVRFPKKEPFFRPLFPRYLFTQGYPWGVVRNAGGEEMGRLMMSMSYRPHQVAFSTITRLLDQVGFDGVWQPPARPLMKKGQQARALDGPFTGFIGTCEMAEETRVKMLMTIFCRHEPVWFERGNLEIV